jgi:hypothetical protein
VCMGSSVRRTSGCEREKASARSAFLAKDVVVEIGMREEEMVCV